MKERYPLGKRYKCKGCEHVWLSRKKGKRWRAGDARPPIGTAHGTNSVWVRQFVGRIESSVSRRVFRALL
jgi:hypothetical protein